MKAPTAFTKVTTTTTFYDVRDKENALDPS
jgi:hypothetical protein